MKKVQSPEFTSGFRAGFRAARQHVLAHCVVEKKRYEAAEEDTGALPMLNSIKRFTTGMLKRATNKPGGAGRK